MRAPNTPVLHVNLAALVANYRALRAAFTGKDCSAVVKANAYGIGMTPAVKALQEAGCERFFVATLEEAMTLRVIAPDAQIAVFHGVGKGEAALFAEHRITPVLCSPDQIERWAAGGGGGRAMLHLDTAMARLGLTESEYKHLREEKPALLEACNFTTVMTHLANASEPESSLNEEQRSRFAAMRIHCPELEASLCNSGGIGLGKDWHCDLARPGCALYGIKPHAEYPISLQPVARWEAPILQLRTLDREQGIGYGATVSRGKGAVLATVATGYADGMLRGLSNRLYGLCAGVKVPLVGRVTMDMLVFDISEVPEQKREQAETVTLMWDEQDVNAIADLADTIGYEVLTRVGTRVKRVYHGGAA